MRTLRAPLRLLAGVLLSVAWLSAAPAAFGVSCAGAAHELTLRAGSVSPGSGTTATAFVFSVKYTDNAGCAPSSIVVTIQGHGSYPLQRTGTDYQAGVTFQRSMSLPAGTHGYSFTAVSGSGVGERKVKLTDVSPAQAIVTEPTPEPTPVPTPKPPPAPPPPAPSTPAPATPAPSSAPASGAPSEPPATAPASPAGSAGPPLVGSLGSGQGGEPGRQPPGNDPLTEGLSGITTTTLVWVGATLGGVVLFLVLSERGQRTTSGARPASVPLPESAAERSADSPYRRRAQDLGPEADMPRWLRPSVQAARFTRPAERRVPRFYGDDPAD